MPHIPTPCISSTNKMNHACCFGNTVGSEICIRERDILTHSAKEGTPLPGVLNYGIALNTRAIICHHRFLPTKMFSWVGHSVDQNLRRPIVLPMLNHFGEFQLVDKAALGVSPNKSARITFGMGTVCQRSNSSWDPSKNVMSMLYESLPAPHATKCG